MKLFGEILSERDMDLYGKRMLGCLDAIVQMVIKHYREALKLFKLLFLHSGIGVIFENS